MVQPLSFFGCVNVYPIDRASVACPLSLVRTPVVAFVMEYWNQQQRNMLFLDPSVVQAMIGFDDASIGPVDDMRQASVIVIPVTTRCGGSTCGVDGDAGGDGGHWSAVVCVRQHTTSSDSTTAAPPPLRWYCLDSSGRHNEAASRRVVALITPMLLATEEENGLGGGGGPRSAPLTRAGDVRRLHYVASFPQQENNVDCGVMLCLAAERLGELALAAASTEQLAHLCAHRMEAAADDGGRASTLVAPPSLGGACEPMRCWWLTGVEAGCDAPTTASVCIELRAQITTRIDTLPQR